MASDSDVLELESHFPLDWCPPDRPDDDCDVASLRSWVLNAPHSRLRGRIPDLPSRFNRKPNVTCTAALPKVSIEDLQQYIKMFVMSINLRSKAHRLPVMLIDNCFMPIGHRISGSRRDDCPDPPVDWLANITTNPEQVRKYLQQYNIEEDAKKTIDLVRTALPHGSTVFFSIEGDYESEGKSLVAQLTINASRENRFDIYDRFVDEWIKSVSTTSVNQICFTYSTR
jgi:hypothetical protein